MAPKKVTSKSTFSDSYTRPVTHNRSKPETRLCHHAGHHPKLLHRQVQHDRLYHIKVIFKVEMSI